MKIDLTCPVELWQFTMPGKDEPACTFVLNNLSEKVVTSVQVTMVCTDAQQELLFRQMERVQGVRAGAGEKFTITLIPSQWNDVTDVDLIFEKVWFDDATIWRRGSAPLTSYQSNALKNGRQLDQLRFVAGKDTVGYPQQQEHVWMCVCGRANPPKGERCCRCGRKRDTVFASFHQANVEHLIAVHEQKLHSIAKKAREDTGKLAQERERIHQRQLSRHKKSRRNLLIASCFIIIAVAILVWGIPAIRYHEATTLMNDSRFEEARAAFTNLGEYRDAQSQLIHCDYLEAKAWLDSGADSKASADVFARLGSYEDSSTLWKQAVYQMGEEALAQGAYETAAEHFQQLDGYLDSSEKLREATYQQAEKLYENKSFIAAKVLFQGLGDYKQTAQMIQACEYAQGIQALDDANYEEALRHFLSIPGYEDVEGYLQKTRYALAEQKMNEEEYEQAGTLYLQAGVYEDAELKANNSLYQLADQQMKAGNYAKAAELFAHIPHYLDSETRGWECVYQQALTAQETGEMAAAELLFSSIPQHGDALERVRQCRYALAMDALAHENLTEAASLLTSLEDYQDSIKQLEDIRYRQAQQAADAGEYAMAADLFGALGNYRDSYKRWEQATLSLATQKKEAGDVIAATELLTDLSQSEEAKALLREIDFAEALQKRDEGDLEGAAELLLTLGDDAQAQQEYQAIQYELATKKMQSDDLLAAGEIFLQLGDYQDAAQKGDECYRRVYGVVADSVREANEAKDYRSVISMLEGYVLDNLPQPYTDLPGLYQEACLSYANELYEADQPYQALPYYQRIPDYKNTSQKLKQKKDYLILGKWESETGDEVEFRPDGSCTLMGDALYFHIKDYTLRTGTSLQNLQATHRVSVLTDEGMTLIDMRGEQDVRYILSRTAEAAPAEQPPAADPITPAPPPTSTPSTSFTPSDSATPSASVVPTLSPSIDTISPTPDALDIGTNDMLVTEDE